MCPPLTSYNIQCHATPSAPASETAAHSGHSSRKSATFVGLLPPLMLADVSTMAPLCARHTPLIKSLPGTLIPAVTGMIGRNVHTHTATVAASVPSHPLGYCTLMPLPNVFENTASTCPCMSAQSFRHCQPPSNAFTHILFRLRKYARFLLMLSTLMLRWKLCRVTLSC